MIPIYYHQWWKKHGFSSAPPNTYGPASFDQLPKLSRREQIDPWEAHTKHCSKCRTALQRFKKAQVRNEIFLNEYIKGLLLYITKFLYRMEASL